MSFVNLNNRRMASGAVVMELRPHMGRSIPIGLRLWKWLAFRRYSLDYVEEEKAAQAASLGVWRGRFVPPWDWRTGIR